MHTEIGRRIKIGRCASFTLYEVTDSELKEIEKGSPNSVYLNFAIFLLTVGSSFLTSLLTFELQSITGFCIFVVVCALGFIIGSILLILWYRNRREIRAVIKRIKDRLEGE